MLKSNRKEFLKLSGLVGIALATNIIIPMEVVAQEKYNYDKKIADKYGLTIDGTDRLYRFLVCTNNPSYWKLSLAYVKKLMNWGADGVFIDNVEKKEECFAPEFTNLNPEFGTYVHEHLFPASTHDYAFGLFLQTVRSLVKSYGEDKIVVLNPGIDSEFQKYGDCGTWESFIYSWAWEGRNQIQSWDKIKERAKKNEWFTQSGHRITALSYLDPSRGRRPEFILCRTFSWQIDIK